MNAALFYALVAAAANVAGGLVITMASPSGRATQRLLMAFGAGFMLAVVLLSMIPHALEGGDDAALAVLGGYLLVHLTQHVLTQHFHFGEEHHEVGRWVGVSALFGILLHTFFDGVAIASGFLVSQELGLVVFTAVVLHKIPEGVTVASVMVASGDSRRRALGGVLLLGVSTVVGVFLTDHLGPLQSHGLALSAGVTLYVAASNLVPEVQRDRDWRLALAVFAGVAMFYGAQLMLGDLHG